MRCAQVLVVILFITQVLHALLSAPYRLCSSHTCRSATGPVGTAEPYISEPCALQAAWRYIVLMTDGVYKSLASFLGISARDDSDSINRQLLSLIQQADAEKNAHVPISKAVVSRIVVSHERTYTKYINSTDMQLKQLAVQCSKRDDLTLIVIKLPPLPT